MLADYTAELGRARPGGKLAPATIARRLVGRALAAALLARPGARPGRPARAAPRPRGCPDAPKPAEVDDLLDAARAGGGALGTAQPRAARARLLRRPAQRGGGRARPRRRRLRAGARPRAERQGREGPRRAARRGGGVTGSRRYLRDARPRARARRRERALPLGARAAARHLDAAPPAAAPPPPAPRVRDAPARGRRRPARDPGAARPLLALDHADLQPRRRQAPPPCLRPAHPDPERREASGDPDVDGAFLALLAARRAPRTVDAYRRDLARLARFLGKPRRGRDASRTSSSTRRSSAPTGSRRRRSRGGPRRRAPSSATCSCSARAPTTRPPSSSCRAGRASCRARSRRARPSG